MQVSLSAFSCASRRRAGGFLLTLLIVTLFPSAMAQLTYRGEVTFATDAVLSQAFPAQVGWALAGHLDAAYQHDPVTLRLVLDPSLRFAPEGTAELGLTELYARVPLDSLDLSAGLERLPLEYARLSVPYSLETISGTGVRRGVPGVRVVWFPEDWRVRAGVLVVNERITPLVSVKRSFGDFELEAHALYPGQAVLGLGGSGLLGDVVLYGEAWLLSAPFSARGVLGVTGFAGDSLWTVEGVYAPSPASPTPHPQLLGQLSLPQGDSASWNFLAGVALIESSAAGQGNISFSYTTPDDHLLTAGAGVQVTPSMTLFSVQIGTTSYF